MKTKLVVFVICALFSVLQCSPFPDESSEEEDYDWTTTMTIAANTTTEQSTTIAASTTTTTAATTTTTARPSRPPRPTFPRPPRPLFSIASAISNTFDTLSSVVQAAGNYAVTTLGSLTESRYMISPPADEFNIRRSFLSDYEPPQQDPIPDTHINEVYTEFD